MTRWYRTYKTNENRVKPLNHEREIQKTILEELTILEKMGKLTFIRNNSFAGKIIRSYTKKSGEVVTSQGYIKNNKKGSSDILIFVDGGKTLFIELKNETGQLKPDQKLFKNFIEKLGFSYYVVRDVETMTKILAPYL